MEVAPLKVEGIEVWRYWGARVLRCEVIEVRRYWGAKVLRCKGLEVRRSWGGKQLTSIASILSKFLKFHVPPDPPQSLQPHLKPQQFKTPWSCQGRCWQPGPHSRSHRTLQHSHGRITSVLARLAWDLCRRWLWWCDPSMNKRIQLQDMDGTQETIIWNNEVSEFIYGTTHISKVE